MNLIKRATALAAPISFAMSLCLSSLPAGATADTPDPEPTIQTIVERHVADARIDGAVLLAKSGEPVFRAGYGLANHEWAIPNTPETRFRIASMTKSFTAVLTMQLVQEGSLDLDAAITAYLPGYPGDPGDRITVRHLLTHRSGIPHYAELPGWRDGRFRPPMTDNEFVAVFAARPLNFEPGSESRYSNSNYFLLGLMIEKFTERAYDEAIHERIFAPLGMNNSGEYREGEIVSKLASDYMPNGGEVSCLPADAAYCKSGFVNMGLFQATGSLYSTVDDLLKWDQALYGERLLSAESKALLFDPDDPFAWFVGELPLGDTGTKVDIIAYNGGINGYTSFIARFPETHHTIIVLNNNGAGYNALVALVSDLATVLFRE